MQKNLTALELYTNRAFRLIVPLAPAAALLAGAVFSLGKLVGWYPTVSPIALIVFELSCLSYLALSIYMVNTAFDEAGTIRPSKLKIGKIFLTLLTVVQWNFISYLIPSVDFWGYAPFFLLLSAFFLDSNMVGYEAAALLISIFISWFIRRDALTSPHDIYYLPNMLLRTVCLILSMGSVYIITKLSSSLLVSELEKLSDYDPLTHLLNRRRLDLILEKAAEDADNERPCSVALFDIDDFKQVNDTYGHAYGDKVLCTIADIISHSVKKSDYVFRWGGEEFLILFSCDGTTAEHACKRILFEIASEKFSPLPDVSIQITMTSGIAEYNGEKSLTEVLDKMDCNLYQGKKNGKNITVFE